MRELGKLYSVGDRVTVVGKYMNYTSSDNKRELVDWVKIFNKEVRVDKKELWGTPLADHFYLPKEEFDLYREADIPAHTGSIVIIKGTVEKYTRNTGYDLNRGKSTYMQDYGIKDIEVKYWISKSKPVVYLYSKDSSGQIIKLHEGKTYQECYDFAVRYDMKYNGA